MGWVLVVFWSVGHIRDKRFVSFHSEYGSNARLTASISVTYRAKSMTVVGKSKIILSKESSPLSRILNNVD